MKKTSLVLSCVALALLSALVIGVGLQAVQASQPVKDARPTPTPDRFVPAREQAIPESPEIPPLPDLIVERIQVDPPRPLIGQEVTIRVTIKNQGTVDVALEPVPNNFWSDLYIDPGVVPIQLGQNGEVEWGCQAWWMSAGSSHTLETTWTFDDVKTYVLYAQVDTDGHVGEANEHNNVLGPVHVEVVAPNKIVHQTHEEFQLGLASSLDVSHPEGVIRRGIFVEPETEPGVYTPDAQVDDPPLPPSFPTNVNQIRPALATDGAGKLFAAWEDGRNGGVFNRDIYFSRSDNQGATWGADVRVNDDPGLPFTVNQVAPDLEYDPTRGRLYAVWQDWRDGDYDIYFAYSDTGGNTWSANQKLNDDAGTANQLNPAITVGPPPVPVPPGTPPVPVPPGTPNRVYAVWQDKRNGNDDIYLAWSDDGGATWSDNYFVTDDPHMTWQNQTAPSVSVDNFYGITVVAWEDWRDPEHPEVYASWSYGQESSDPVEPFLGFDIDVPVSVVAPEIRDTYRLDPAIGVFTTVEWVQKTDEFGFVYWVEVPITVIHVAYQDWNAGTGSADIYYSYAWYDWEEYTGDNCPYPYDFCFEEPQEVSGFAINSDYVRPPNNAPVRPLEPSWQGQVSLDLVPDGLYWTLCHADSTRVYSKGVVIAWSDDRTYDEWRHEIRTRRVASPEGDPKQYEPCEDWAAGMVNDGVKLYAYRDDLALYEIFQPAAVRQSNPYLQVDPTGIYVVWDDDRHDEPLEPNTVRDRDIFFAQMGSEAQGLYISPVIDSHADATWYVLSWWGATQQLGDLLFQTRFGSTPNPPQGDVASGGWTRWTGNPSSEYLDCPTGPGVDCYYDAPGRHIVGPAGNEWPEARYMQYKVIIRARAGFPPSDRLTAVSQVVIHYKGPTEIYLPVVQRAP